MGPTYGAVLRLRNESMKRICLLPKDPFRLTLTCQASSHTLSGIPQGIATNCSLCGFLRLTHQTSSLGAMSASITAATGKRARPGRDFARGGEREPNPRSAKGTDISLFRWRQNPGGKPVRAMRHAGRAALLLHQLACVLHEAIFDALGISP